MKKKLISICIPTYNGEKKIAKTLESIIRNIIKLDTTDDIEVVLTDDASSDSTFSIVENYVRDYAFVKLFRNGINLGMDGNFKQAALNAGGEYIWFSGQDDIFLDSSVEHVLNALKADPSISIVNVNFKQFSESEDKVVCESMFHLQANRPEEINPDKDMIFNGSAEYFDFFNDSPSFLPATIMKRDFWLTTDVDAYHGTYFIQYAAILLNMKNHKILAVTRPSITGLIPAAGWQTDGNKLFSIQLGAMKARKSVYKDDRNPFPAKVFKAKKNYYRFHFLRTTVAASYYGFKPSIGNKMDIKFIYGAPAYYLFFLPILFLVGMLPRRLLSQTFLVRRYFKH